MLKKSTSISQLLLVLFGLLAVFLLYFFGATSLRTPKESADSEGRITSEVIVPQADEEELLRIAQKNLSTIDRERLNSISPKENKLLSEFWFSQDQYSLAAIYQEKVAQKENTFTSWDRAGDLFVRAFREEKDSTKVVLFLNKALNTYESANSLEESLTTKLKIAKLHIDVTGQIMNGVMLLQAIVEKEPNHIQANYELGLLSIRSGQIEKAMSRFDKVITAKPDFIEPYLLKSQLYLQQKDKTNAIKMIEAAIVHASEESQKVALTEMKNKIINN